MLVKMRRFLSGNRLIFLFYAKGFSVGYGTLFGRL